MSGVLIDLNIALDLFHARQPWATDAATIWKANQDGRMVVHLASISIPTLFYVVRKQRGLASARLAVSDCLSSLTIIPVALSTLRLAEAGPGSDFEDNIQIASAGEAGLDAIVTRDPKGFVGSLIPVFSPVDLLAWFGKKDGP